MAVMGRPSDFSKEKAAEIVAAMDEYLFLKHAAQSCGVTERTVARWKKRGEEDLEKGIDSDYAYFCQSVNCQMSRTIKIYLDPIKKVVNDPKNIQQAQWMLSKLDNASFGADTAAITELKAQIEELRNLISSNLNVNKITQSEIPIED